MNTHTPARSQTQRCRNDTLSCKAHHTDCARRGMNTRTSGTSTPIHALLLVSPDAVCPLYPADQSAWRRRRASFLLALPSVPACYLYTVRLKSLSSLCPSVSDCLAAASQRREAGLHSMPSSSTPPPPHPAPSYLPPSLSAVECLSRCLIGSLPSTTRL